MRKSCTSGSARGLGEQSPMSTHPVNYLYTSLCTFFICSIVLRRNLHSLSVQSAKMYLALRIFSSLTLSWISPRRQSTVVSNAFAISIILESDGLEVPVSISLRYDVEQSIIFESSSWVIPFFSLAVFTFFLLW